jgi:hypothetical protein
MIMTCAECRREVEFAEVRQLGASSNDLTLLSEVRLDTPSPEWTVERPNLPNGARCPTELPNRRRGSQTRGGLARHLHIGVERFLCTGSTEAARPGRRTSGFCNPDDRRSPCSTALSDRSETGRTGHHRLGVGPLSALGVRQHGCELVRVKGEFGLVLCRSIKA